MQSKPKISVITWCYSRQKMLDLTLPKWLDQDYPNYEIIVGHGPGVKVMEHWPDPTIKPYYTSELGLCRAYNMGVVIASGDILLLTQCDMEVNSKTQLSRMYDVWSEKRIVTERWIKGRGTNGVIRDNGYYLQFAMVSKAEYLKAGGFFEAYDNPETVAHEDGDLMATFLENGLDIVHTTTPEDDGVYHIEHPRPNFDNPDPVLAERLRKGRAIYDSRHTQNTFTLYAKQLSRQLMDRGRKI